VEKQGTEQVAKELLQLVLLLSATKQLLSCPQQHQLCPIKLIEDMRDKNRKTLAAIVEELSAFGTAATGGLPLAQCTVQNCRDWHTVR